MFEKVNEFYDTIISEKGVEDATGWTKSGQKKRFDIITSQITKNNCSILDFGCNVGNYFEYLDSKNIKFEKYYGIDINIKFIEQCRNKFKDRIFLCGNILDDNFYSMLPKFDTIITSGVFNLYYENCRENNQKMIKRLWEKCDDTLICNFLTSFTDFELKKKNLYYSPEEIIFILRELKCNSFNIIHDYLHNDFTIVMRRNWRLYENRNTPA